MCCPNAAGMVALFLSSRVLVLSVQIVMGYSRALQTALDACGALAEVIDVDNGPQLKKLVDAAVGTKFSARWGFRVSLSSDRCFVLFKT